MKRTARVLIVSLVLSGVPVGAHQPHGPVTCSARPRALSAPVQATRAAVGVARAASRLAGSQGAAEPPEQASDAEWRRVLSIPPGCRVRVGLRGVEGPIQAVFAHADATIVVVIPSTGRRVAGGLRNALNTIDDQSLWPKILGGARVEVDGISVSRDGFFRKGRKVGQLLVAGRDQVASLYVLDDAGMGTRRVLIFVATLVGASFLAGLLSLLSGK